MFETINLSPLTLGVFDMMVARLYPHEFKLRENWENATQDGSLPESMDGLMALRVIALREYLGEKRSGVKGIIKGDILQLDPEVVIEQWSGAVQALRSAEEIFRMQLGAGVPSIFPAETMLSLFLMLFGMDLMRCSKRMCVDGAGLLSRIRCTAKVQPHKR